MNRRQFLVCTPAVLAGTTLIGAATPEIQTKRQQLMEILRLRRQNIEEYRILRKRLYKIVGPENGLKILMSEGRGYTNLNYYL